MATYYVRLSVSKTVELRLFKLDAELMKALDDEGGVSKIDCSFIFENELESDYYGIVINSCLLESFDPDDEDFSLVVEDEDGDVVYETTDPMSIVHHPNTDDEGEFIYPPTFKFKGVEPGTYLVENNILRYCELNGTFEADEFDPSKLEFFPSEYLDDWLCEDDTFLDTLCYDGKSVGLCDEDDMSRGSEFNLLEAKELNEDNCNFSGYRMPDTCSCIDDDEDDDEEEVPVL